MLPDVWLIMKRLSHKTLVNVSGALCLLAMPLALHASERRAAPEISPYRLAGGATASASDAPYLLDPRYRLEPPPAAVMPLPETPYARQIDDAAREAGVDPALVNAVISVESAYQSTALSPKGAVGLMQVMPETALRYGVSDPSGVSANLRAGARHLRSLMVRYDDRLELALAAYNAGEGAVKRYNNTIPPYAETRHYVPAVIARYRAASRNVAASSKNAGPAVHDYLPGTRLEPLALSRLR